YRSHLGSKVGDSNSFRAGEKISLSRRLWAPKGGARSLSVSSRDDTIRVNGEDVTFEDFEGAGWSLWIRLDT
ncbi:MAG: hypothetical protein KDB18_13780, partial [Salinibacterium sp.]|nr:hypothetical protein [Salinibacterium sp.]